MLLSMTGFGEARGEAVGCAVVVEVRTVNNRYLKVSTKCPDAYAALETAIERLVRDTVKRGTVQVVLRVERPPSAEDYRLNRAALLSYARQLDSIRRELNQPATLHLEMLLSVPGVVLETSDPETTDHHWPLICPVVEEALRRMQGMRRDEGRAMARDLLETRDAVARSLDAIAGRSAGVVEAYRDRLHDRVRSLLIELDVQIDRKELIKEVSIFAERSDIAEEIVRLRSHLDQFQSIMNEPESAGRKLEFLSQEMFREANTIGAKASDVEISRQVVEMKGAIEKIREMIQNVE